MTWDAASRISGMFIDEPTFAARFEQEEQGLSPADLHQYVDHYDDAGLVLKTNQQVQQPVTQHDEPESIVSKTAKHAIRRKK